jgi:hypothetical protein
MSAHSFEAFLARIYVDVGARARFKANPRGEARRAGLSDEECTALEDIDWVGLEMAARSFARKRQSNLNRRRALPLWDRLRQFLVILSKRLRFHEK